jgi:hypothetical protein
MESPSGSIEQSWSTRSDETRRVHGRRLDRRETIGSSRLGPRASRLAFGSLGGTRAAGTPALGDGAGTSARPLGQGTWHIVRNAAGPRKTRAACSASSTHRAPPSCAPVVFEGDNWDIYALLRRQYRPVEMIRFPYGAHSLARPSERMTSLQGNVDWYRFWLKGEKRTEPLLASETVATLTDQYARWDQMLALKQLVGAGPGCVRTPAGE